MSDTTQLIAVLGMLGSQFDGEALNAARLAERMRLKMNKTWQQLLSGGSSSSDLGYMTRALRAERMVADLTMRVGSLERELADLRQRAGSSSAGSSAGSSSTGSTSRPRATRGVYKYRLTPEVENDLVDAMLLAFRAADEIYRITRWPRAHLRVVLNRIAANRRLNLIVRTRWGNTEYRFERV